MTNRHVWLWALALTPLFALYALGATYGNPRDTAAPLPPPEAGLNPSTIYHPDEFFYVALPFRLLREPGMDLVFYENPPLVIYANLGLFAAAGAQAEPYHAALEDRAVAPFKLYVLGRFASACYALLNTALAAAAGRVAFGRVAGTLAALLAGVSPLVVQHAHYATPNLITLLASTAALLAAFRIVRYPRRGGWRAVALHALAGLLVGISMAGRYNAAAVGLVTGLAMLTAAWRTRRLLPLLVGGLAMPLGFVLIVPDIVTDWRNVSTQIRWVLDLYRSGGGGPGFSADYGAAALFYHWRYTALFVVGPVAAALAAGGAIRALRRWRTHGRDAWIAGALLLYMLAYTVIALRGKRIQANLLFPLIVPLALLAGYEVAALWERWGRRPRVLVGLATVLLAWPAFVSVLFAYRVSVPDNRQHAQDWIYAHVPRGATVYLLGAYNVPLDAPDYWTHQTYKGGATLEQVQAETAQIIVYSDAGPFTTLRVPSLSDDYPGAVETERAIKAYLDETWIEVARFERMWWPGEQFPPDDVSYWHQIGITIYCNPQDCPVRGAAGGD